MGVIEMPDVAWRQVAFCLVELVDMSDRPAGMGADLVERDPHHLIDARGLVGGAGDDLAQLQEVGLLAQRLLRALALSDVETDAADRADLAGEIEDGEYVGREVVLAAG